MKCFESPFGYRAKSKRVININLGRGKMLKNIEIDKMKKGLFIPVCLLLLFIINDLGAQYKVIVSTPGRWIFSGTKFYMKVNFLGIKTPTLPFKSDTESHRRSMYYYKEDDNCLKELPSGYVEQECTKNKILNGYIKNVNELLESSFKVYSAFEKNGRIYIIIFKNYKTEYLFEYQPEKNKLKKIMSAGDKSIEYFTVNY